MEGNPLIIMGYPSHPHFGIRLREPGIKANPSSNGHVSCISNRRIEELAQAAGLVTCDFRSGYFMRWSGSVLENNRWWQVFNNWWGNRFPWWPSEAFVKLRRDGALG